mmetsp:Transcript_62422/g.171461  ORF Transcript_62422/g.171461 Transcript_62422/m.171461 type:complete len:268 (+) Transcript_62422:819-1622(+)
MSSRSMACRRCHRRCRSHSRRSSCRRCRRCRRCPLRCRSRRRFRRRTIRTREPRTRKGKASAGRARPGVVRALVSRRERRRVTSCSRCWAPSALRTSRQGEGRDLDAASRGGRPSTLAARGAAACRGGPRAPWTCDKVACLIVCAHVACRWWWRPPRACTCARWATTWRARDPPHRQGPAPRAARRGRRVAWEGISGNTKGRTTPGLRVDEWLGYRSSAHLHHDFEFDRAYHLRKRVKGRHGARFRTLRHAPQVGAGPTKVKAHNLN